MIAILSLFALLVAAPESEPSQRETVESVAGAIARNYFDEETAATISAELRREAEEGRYDDLTGPQLATALTRRLENLDRHFRVIYAPAGQGQATERVKSAYGREEQDRRSGYGFRQVSVLPANVGYIEMSHFAPIQFNDPDSPARRSADAALALVGRTDALIVDLRDNGGGDPGMVGYLVSAFVGPERDVYNVFHARGRQQSERPPVAYPDTPLAMPVYVLTSGRTGSAAEAFAYTLQAAGRAQVVGEASGGAANPGGVVKLPGGFGVFVSGASPRNPLTGGNWEGSGVQPDIASPSSDAMRRAHILAIEKALGTIPAAERIDAERTLAALRANERSGSPERLTAYAGEYQGMIVEEQGGQLTARVGRRPPVKLNWMEGDTFFPAGSPATRFIFSRDGSGAVAAVQVETVDGSRSEYREGRSTS